MRVEIPMKAVLRLASVLIVSALIPAGAFSADSQSRQETLQTVPDFVSLARKLAPIVVNFSTRQKPSREEGPSPRSREGDPFGEFWRRFFGEPFDVPPGGGVQEQLGSGFIIDANGIV